MNEHALPKPLDVLLSDGSVATIRPMQPSDERGLLDLHDSATDASLRMRFFTASRTSGRHYVEHLIRHTGDTLITLVAVVDDHIIGQATAERMSADSAEVAFMVADAAQGHGIGSLLLEHLAAACHELGVRTLVADVLADNRRMLRVFLDAGFTVSRHLSSGVASLEISTSITDGVLRAADLREFQSEARSLHPLLYPRAVAVLGVRRSGGGIGRAVLDSILTGKFDGKVYVVHPQADAVPDVPCFSSLTAIPDHVDLAIVTVPAPRVVEALRDAATAKVSSVVVISSGFSEVGSSGAALQREALRIAREHSIRLVGPNCLGVLTNAASTHLNATFSRALPPSGGLAIASQSGGVGIVMLDLAAKKGLGVQSFVSLGNKADVSSNDLLAAWFDDPHVTAAALYLESFGNAAKFARIARRFAERKPLMAVVGGRSSGGIRAGASHTAAAATPATAIDAAFARAGVIACRSPESMARTALLLQQQPLPGGRRIGIVGNAGGIGVLAADAAEQSGLVVPELSATLQAEMRQHVEGTAGLSNPIDLGAATDAPHLSDSLDLLLSSGEVDVVIVALVATNVTDSRPMLAALAETRSRHPGVPVVLIAMGGLELLGETTLGVTAFETPDQAIEALALAAGYAEWLRTPPQAWPAVDEERSISARRRAQDLLARATDSGGMWLGPREVGDLLAPYSLQQIGWVADDPLNAADAAAALRFPVVVKVADEHIIHKTDRGLVRVGLMSSADVEAAVRDFAKELDREAVPVLVQPVVQGVELAIGVVQDPGFGPLVMVGAGGVATAIWNDRTFLLPPITRTDATRALRSLRLWPLLEGYRGSVRVDIEALERLVCSVGDLAREVPEVAELDVNPVMASPRGCAVVDVKMRLAHGNRLTAGIPRSLRARP